jgi:hypothetical protein
MTIFKPNSKTTTLQMTVPDENTPVIFITTYALMKMNNYIQNSDKEISWLGVVEHNENVFMITDVMLFEQEVTGTTTEIDEGHLSSFGTRLIQTGQMDLYNKIRMWGHSHVKLDVYASKTDEETFEQFYENCEFFIRLIANQKGDMKVDFIDNERHIKYLDMDWYENKTDAQIKLEELINQFNKSMEELNNKIKEDVKVEIEANIIDKKKVGSSTQTNTESHTSTTRKTGNGGNEPMIRIRKGNAIVLTNIKAVFTEDEIITLMEKCYNYWDLSDELKQYAPFEDYGVDDYRDLYSKMITYFYNTDLVDKSKARRKDKSKKK